MRQQERSQVKSPLSSFTPSAHPIFSLSDFCTPTLVSTCTPCHQETIGHSAAKHSLRWTCPLTILPSFALSVSSMPSPPFCSVYSLGYGLRAQRSGVSPWKLNKDKDTWRNVCRLCHIDSSLTHVLISATIKGFCQMLKCCPPPLPAPLVLFTWVSGRNGVTVHRQKRKSIHADMSSHTKRNVKYSTSTHVELQYPYILRVRTLQFV